MDDSTIEFLAEEEALDEIVETVMRADKGEAPFALVLGSGFSRGLVPTANELVTESLPLWVKSREENKEFDGQAGTASQRAKIARSFWEGFVERNQKRKLDLKLNPATGLPEDSGEAYRSAFSPRYTGAVGAPAEARRFQRALMQLNRPRLNAAHFLLASLLGVQPGKTRESSLFRARAAFSRLILTTNFDPFLQTALQAVNRLYFMSDTPELGVTDEIFDDQTDAIHLVYLHGSIHRRSQAATDDEIQRLKEKNARTLAPVLKRRGVIVLGYSGWDDAIVAALAACDGFDYRLYWCGLESDPLAKGAFGAGVEDILRKHSAIYVQSAGAGNFMAQLCRGLVKGNPRLIDNPISQLRELLDIIDLKELEEFRPPVSPGSNAPQLLQSGSAATAVVRAKQSTIERLKLAEQIFLGEISDPSVVDQASATGVAVAPEVGVDSKIQQLWSSAELALGLGNTEECVKLCDEALTFINLETSERTKLLTLRALAHYFSGRTDDALRDWSQAIELPDAPVEQVAEALYNRGVTWGQKGDTEKALADYTRLIEQLPEAPVEQVAQALNNRGVAWGQQGDTEKELADYTRVIEQLPEAPVDQMAQALNNRGVTWGQKGDTEKALADYTRVIEQLPEAPVEQLAKALNNRGVAWGQKGDMEKALADYTRLIEQLPEAPVDQMAKALNNRGVTWGQKGDMEKEIADYTRVIEQLPEAPVEQVAQALNYRGITWDQKGQTEKALADYTRVIEQLPEAPVEQVAQALNFRGVAWGQQGDTEKELDDYTRVIEQLPKAPVDQMAQALNNRGVTWGQKGDTEKALADYTRVIEQLPEAPVEQMAKALNNRGVTWSQQGETEKELADYTRLIEQLPKAPVEQVAQALCNRGVAWGQQGETEKELADYTRLIEQLPEAPVEQIAKALNNRGVTWGQQGDMEKALADYTRLIEQLPGAPVEQVAQALNNRGVAWSQQGETEKELADYTRVIEQLPEAPVEQVAKALYNRGVTWGQKGDTEKALADYTRVIEQLPEAPVEQVAQALNNRGVAWGQQGDMEKALADYTRVIEQLPEASVEQVAQALGSRGWLKYQKQEFAGFLADTEAALNKDPALDFAAFNLGLALLTSGRDADALAAYRAAGERFPESIEALGLEDLKAKPEWLSDERAQPVIYLLESLKK